MTLLVYLFLGLVNSLAEAVVDHKVGSPHILEPDKIRYTVECSSHADSLKAEVISGLHGHDKLFGIEPHKVVGSLVGYDPDIICPVFNITDIRRSLRGDNHYRTGMHAEIYGIFLKRFNAVKNDCRIVRLNIFCKLRLFNNSCRAILGL